MPGATAAGSLVMASRAERMATGRRAAMAGSAAPTASGSWWRAASPPRTRLPHRIGLQEIDRPQPRLEPPAVGGNAGEQFLNVLRRLGEDELTVAIHSGAIEKAVEMAARPQIVPVEPGVEMVGGEEVPEDGAEG